ncbi:MAG: DUF6370 family protein [Flavitalea sp.]
MKQFILFFSLAILTLSLSAQKSTPVTKSDTMVVEASCGQCKFGMKTKAKSCDLAVRIDGKPYFVDGTSLDDHGDAHSDEGFCNSIRKAAVQGKIVNNRFKATYFKLLPATPKKDDSNQ